ERVLREICHFSTGMGFKILGLVPSPIKGPKGNKEFLLYAVNEKSGRGIDLEEAIMKSLQEKD
ncbi:MAG: TlyA family RNA methyltransferase, partial [bacterium]